MDWVIVAGCLCLGAIIGSFATFYFFSNYKERTGTKVLVATTSACIGTSVMAMFSFLAGFAGPTREYWFYPVGLFIGFAFVMILDFVYFDYGTGNRRKR
ncbi:hypothetical protein V1290_004418 [Bradyrhizobium sp. AZCC 1578]|uniref:hypothetical protein n=1 Tax=Bradyrhizobium sp. AZCC 1578 TaxID=3117027 RepID=UPI002FEFD481